MMFVFIIYHLNYRQIQTINQTAKSGSIIFPRELASAAHKKLAKAARFSAHLHGQTPGAQMWSERERLNSKLIDP